MLTRYSIKNSWAKWSAWEHWPAGLFNLPVIGMWLVQGIRCRDLLFFSCVNPDIPTGGFFSEEKWPIYKKFPQKYIPTGILITTDETFESVLSKFEKSEIKFPVLVKPNIGERGMGIEKIKDEKQLGQYHQRVKYAYIIQCFISFPLEMSVLAYQVPGRAKVEVTSICLKEKLTLMGDGSSTIEELALADYRSRKNWSRLSRHFDNQRILDRGEALLLEPIGNHSRGTTFLDGNSFIDQEFVSVIQQLFHAIDGKIHYGRLDIIYRDMDSFKQLIDFSVIEFNGVGSEPAHIYQPGYPLFRAYRELWKHSQIMGRIARIQKKRGVLSMKWSEFWTALRVYKKNLNLVRQLV